MTSKPIYRLMSHAAATCDEDGNHGRTQYLVASIKIPDVLGPGDKIHLDFPLINSKDVDDGSPGAKVRGGGFIEIDENNVMQFDGT